MPDKQPSSPAENQAVKGMAEALQRIEKARLEKSVTLNLSGLALTTLPESLGNLTALQGLDLSDNQLTTLPEWLGNLTALQSLYLYGNQLTTLPESLGNLTALQSLYLSNNQLTTLPESLGNLTALQWLYLSGNQLTTVPESLGNLTALQGLDLSDNQLTMLPEWLGNLTALQWLNLSGNQLTTLPESLGNLTALQSLYLYGNQLTTLPESLGNLTALQTLILYGNQLTALPESLGNLKGLKGLYLHENSGLGLSPEILGPTWRDALQGKVKPADPRAILAVYFAQRKRDAKPLNEVKLLLVGHGRVGKTSLSKALRGVAHDAKEPETPGIERHPLALTAGKSAITAHIWDFGGQEFLHQTHQFFFSERSLYLVVLAGRDRAPMQEAEYWLRLIRTYGTGSPVVIVLNKIKEHHFTVDEFNLKDRYPEVKAVVEVDCDPRHNITELRKLLGALAGEMPGVREKIAPAWANVRTELENRKESHLCYTEYQKICEGFGVKTAEQQETLATILNCLGIALNYRHDPRLRDKSILKPRWLVDGIYSVLRWMQKHETNGVLNLADFSKALEDRKTYPPDMHEFLLALMEKFELCFPLDKTADGRAYLVPGLLDENQPRPLKEFTEGKAQRIQFRYDDLRPPGLIPRFIVRSHTLSAGQQLCWRRGVVLSRGQAQALVRGDHAGRVTDVFAIGENTEDRVWLTEFILAEMALLNGRLPVNTLVESESQSGAWTELEVLREADRKQETTRLEKTAAKGMVEVKVKETLRKVESAEASEPNADCLPLFVCYSHANEKLVKELKPSLTILERRGYIAPWRDTDLVPGEDWDETIKERLAHAELVLFMVSRQFLASGYITTEERPLAMQLMNEGKTVVVPVLLSACTWETENFARLENLPDKGKYVTDYRPHEQAWTMVEKGIMKAVEKFRSDRKIRDMPLEYARSLRTGIGGIPRNLGGT